MVAGALRFEDYSDFGNTTKGKITTRVQINDEWAVRGAYSTGFRAPTVGQSNVRNVTTAFTENGLQDQATLPPTHPISQLKGATQLQPEESKSLSFGIVADFDSGLYVTLDFFSIKVEDRISQTSPITLSAADKELLLSQGVRDASSLSSVKYFTNDFDSRTNGADLVINYATEIAGGETQFGFAYNYTDTEITVDPLTTNIGAAKIEMLEDNLPDTRYTFTTNWSKDDWTLLGRINYYGDFYEDHLDAGGAFNIYAGAEYTVDAEVSYHFAENYMVSVGAKNLFDETPDGNPFATVVGSQYPTTSPIGINGGYYYFRLAYTF